MYRVTAWNSGGEGNMSVPLPGGKLPLLGYLPCSKLTYGKPFWLEYIILNLIMHLYFCIPAPKSIAAENIDIHREAGALDIRLHVSCD